MQTNQHYKQEYLTQLRLLISDWIAKNAYKNSLITITKCELSEFGGRISVYVSVFPTDGFSGALSFLRRHGADIADYLRDRQPNRRKPYLLFEPDISFQNNC